jgi:hypothetical protein
MVSFVDRQILTLLFDPIRRTLRISDTQVSLLSGFAFAFLYSLLGMNPRRPPGGSPTAGHHHWAILHSDLKGRP